jgi:hypothetical protein
MKQSDLLLVTKLTVGILIRRAPFRIVVGFLNTLAEDVRGFS